MKYVITESQSKWIKRRIDMIDNLVNLSLSQVKPSDYNYHDYVEEIAWYTWDKMSSEEVVIDSDNMEDFFDYIRDNYWKEIETYYLKNR